MKEIKKFLNNDEEIKWKYCIKMNLLKKIIGIFFLGIILTIIITIILIIVLIFFKIESLELYLGILVLFFFLYLAGISFIYISFINFKSYAKEFDLKFRELRSYTEIYALTNKRWLQKTPYFFNIDYSKYPKAILAKHNDFISVSLEKIQEIFLFEGTESGIELYLINKNDKEDYVCFGGKIPIEEVKEIKKVLKNLIPIDREEHEFGGIRYHRKN